MAEPTGNMMSTSAVAPRWRSSHRGIVVSQSLRVGGDEMDDAIVTHIKKEGCAVGQQTAEETASRSVPGTGCWRRCRPRCEAATC